MFDAFTVLGLFLLGLRLRRGREGRLLGLALAYAWVSFPYTLFPLMSNGNDGLIAMLVVYALLALSSPPARGALVALAGAAKFAPLALVPLFATGGETPRTRSWVSFGCDLRPRRPAGRRSLSSRRSVAGRCSGTRPSASSFSRESPFSVWGQNPGLDPLLTVVKVAVVVLGVMLAFVPRTRDAVQVAALGAAVLLATQFIAIHWFYLYIVWFAPFVLVALFGEYSPRAAAGRSRCPRQSRCRRSRSSASRSSSAHARPARRYPARDGKRPHDHSCSCATRTRPPRSGS